MGRFTGVLGLLVMLALAYLFSTERKAIKLKTVLWGLGLQLSFAIFVLRFSAKRLPDAKEVVRAGPARENIGKQRRNHSRQKMED